MIPPASSPPVAPDAGQETRAGPARTGGRMPWRAAGIGLTSLGTPVGIGVADPCSARSRSRSSWPLRSRSSARRYTAARPSASAPSASCAGSPTGPSLPGPRPRGYPVPCTPVTGVRLRQHPRPCALAVLRVDFKRHEPRLVPFAAASDQQPDGLFPPVLSPLVRAGSRHPGAGPGRCEGSGRPSSSR